MQLTKLTLSSSAWTKVHDGGGTLRFGNVSTALELFVGDVAAPANLEGIHLPAHSLSGLNTLANIPSGVSTYLRTHAKGGDTITVISE